jgi:hypothetical protein
MKQILKELQGTGSLGEQYIQVLIAQELSGNSKWIISSNGATPIIDLRGTATEAPETGTPATTTP